jgi:phospholipid transport system substrate-binding protein
MSAGYFGFYLVLFLDYGEKMKRLNVVLLMLSMLMSSTLFANEEEAVTEVAQTTEQGPVQAIQSTIVKLNQLTTATSYSPQMVKFLVDSEIAPLFDFDHISNEVLLVSNVSISEDEAKFFSNRLKQNIITTLLSRLAQSRSSSFNFVSARPVMGGNIIVKLKARGYSRFGFNIDLSFHKSQSEKWQIFDIALNHDSLINYYQRMVLIKARRYGVYGMLGRI